MNASSSTISTLSVVVICGGVFLFLATLSPIRHSWSRRLKNIHEWFYHPDELKPAEPEPEPIVESTLLDQVEIHGWDYSMYEERDGQKPPKS